MRNKPTKTFKYHGITIRQFHASPPGHKYLKPRNFYIVLGLNHKGHFDTLEDAKAFIRKWANRQITRDTRRLKW